MKLVTVTPTTVFTGFLGSGKTTIISHLIDELQKQGKQVAYIKNEIGDADLDAQMMRGKNILSKELLNGCICCTLVGPFVNALDEVIDTIKPDRIIIESAGSADPASLALMVQEHPRLLRDGVIAVIDVVNFTGYKNLTPVAERQTELVDLIIFNKIEEVELAQKQKVVGYVRELNQYSPIIESPGGKVPLEAVFGIDTSFTQELMESKKVEGHHHDHVDHEIADAIQGFSFSSDQPFDKSKFQAALSQLPANIFRVKGYATFADGSQLIVNGVYKRADFLEPTDTQHLEGSKLICIGYHALEVQATVDSLFQSCLV